MINPNDPAMPQVVEEYHEYPDNMGDYTLKVYKPGLTIREEFAARAMQGLLSMKVFSICIPIRQKEIESLVEDSVSLADKLIEKLNEK